MGNNQIVNKYYNYFLTKDDALPHQFLEISSTNIGNMIYEITGFLQSNNLDLDFESSKKVVPLSLRKWISKKRKHQKKLKFLEKKKKLGKLTKSEQRRLSRLRAKKDLSLYKETNLGKRYEQDIQSMKLYDSTGNIEIILKNHQFSNFMYEKPDDKYRKGHEIGVCVTINYKTKFSIEEKNELKKLKLNPRLFKAVAERLEPLIEEYFKRFQILYKSKHLETQYFIRKKRQLEEKNKYVAAADITLKGLRQRLREEYKNSKSDTSLELENILN